jgi:hypothetical protein
MTPKLITLPQVREILHTIPGAKFRRAIWDPCRIIRSPVEADRDLINYDLGKPGLIIEDCPKKYCDCKAGIWPFTPADAEATDYIQVT